MAVKIVNAQTLLAEKLESKHTRESKVYFGSVRNKAEMFSGGGAAPIEHVVNGKTVVTDSIPYQVGSAQWKNSDARFNLYRDLKSLQDRIQNAATAPSATTLAEYFAKVFIDIQRAADSLADYSASIYNVWTREDAGEVTYLRDFLPYTGKEKVISGENDTVPLIEQNLAQLEQITLQIRAFGWKDSLKNMVFNPLNVLQRVTEAAATILVDSRNNDIIGNIVSATYPASQTVPADATGATYDIQLYNTFKNAILKLASLKHVLTGKELSETGVFSGGIKILCHPADLWQIEKIVNGGLSQILSIQQITQALPFSEIIAYGAGHMHGMEWAKETLSFPGVAKGEAYAFLPNPLGGIVLDKRPLTLETGTGSVLALSTEERAWYRINGLFHKWFMGGAHPGGKAGTGNIVKVTLPEGTGNLSASDSR